MPLQGVGAAFGLGLARYFGGATRNMSEGMVLAISAALMPHPKSALTSLPFDTMNI